MSHRDQALTYISRLTPGTHITSKDLSSFIGTKKSETLRVMNWLVDQKYVKKNAAGPQTSYMVEERDTIAPCDPEAEYVKTVDAAAGRNFDDIVLKGTVQKNNQAKVHSLFRLTSFIDDQYQAVTERLSFLKEAYEKEPMFRNDYLLQFLYGQLELLEKLKGEI